MYKKILQTLALLFACCQLALAEPARVALVIGNADYEVGALANPLNDARAIARALKEAQFEVKLVENASQAEMESAVDSFGRRTQPGSIALFYYSGHGAQYSDQNYLIPVNDKDIINAALGAVYNSTNEPLSLYASYSSPFGTRSAREAREGLV